MPNDIRDNAALSRFELDAGGETAFAYYRKEPGVITITHTEVPSAIGGRGVGTALVLGALKSIRAQGLKVVPRCPFVGAVMARHREFDDLLL